jgi:S-adenosylmethionine synthetase
MPDIFAHKLSRGWPMFARTAPSTFCGPTARPRSPSNTRRASPSGSTTWSSPAQHNENIAYADLVEAIKKEVIFKVIPREMVDAKRGYFINTTGGSSWAVPWPIAG